MEKKILLIAFILVSINAFSENIKLTSQLMFTDNWYTANTFYEESSFEINIPDSWSLKSTVFYNEKKEKVAEGIGYFLYKIEIGQQYNGVIEDKIPPYVEYEPRKIIEKKEGKTKFGYLYDLEIISTVAKSDEGYIVWYPCQFFIYNLDYCFRINFYARDKEYQKELDNFIKIINTIKFPCITNGIMNDDNVRIREEPNLKSKTLGKLNKNHKVEIIGSTISTMKIENMNNKWYKILLSNNNIGWIYGAYVDLEK